MGAAEKIEHPITVSVQAPDKAQIERDSQAMLDQAKALTITTQDDYQAAADQLTLYRGQYKELDDQRKKLVKPLNDTVKNINQMFKPALSFLEDAGRITKTSMATFYEQQERIRREAEAKAAEQARKEQERLAARAEKAREKGHDEKAEALEMQAATTVAAPVAAPQPKAGGAHVRKVWKAELTDKMALIKAVAEGKASAELLDYNESVGNGLAKALKSSLDIPGLKPVEESVVVAR